ncbi:DUF6461 domain-containing protein [Streptosporangium sp. NPDC003464]
MTPAGRWAARSHVAGRPPTGGVTRGRRPHRGVRVGSRPRERPGDISGFDCSTMEGLSALSRDSGRALSVSWAINGDGTLDYATDGQMITSLTVIYPALRDGADPHALDPSLEGLRFELGSGREGASIEESISSALTLIGRITGREIEREWLDGTHALYVMPSRD